MKAEDYEAWYETAKGRRIALAEYQALRQHLDPRPADSILDVGCGTGQFTRRFAERNRVVIGLDSDVAWLRFAASRQTHKEAYVAGDAICLPFADKSVDLSISVAALCFVAQQRQAVLEMIRVTRRRVVLGLLNRRSPLFLAKGRDGGTGAYRGAHWHTANEAVRLFNELPVVNIRTQTVVAFTGNNTFVHALERLLPVSWPWGAFLVVSGDIQAEK